MTIESNQIPTQTVESCEFVAEPIDSRCRYWAKVVTAETALPMPSAVNGANDVPAPYLRKGEDVEVFVGDFVLHGEEVSHRRQRGWTYKLLRCMIKDGEVGLYNVDYKSVKDALRAAGQKDLLRGSGDVAAMIRAIHARRLGL